MALQLFSRRPLSKRRERMRRHYRFVCWLLCVLGLVIIVGVGSGSLPDETGRLIGWCLIGLYMLWVDMSILLVIWSAVLWARGKVNGQGREPGPGTALARLPEAAPPSRNTELALRRESGLAVRGAGTLRPAEGGPLYARSAEAAATIVSLCQHSDLPATQLFGNIQLCIIEAMRRIGDDHGR